MGPYDKQILEARKQAFDLIQKGRSIVDKVEREKRDMNTEERAEFDALNATVEKHDKRIADMEKVNKDQNGEGGGAGDGDVDPAMMNDERNKRPPIDTRTGKPDTRKHASEAYREAYRHFLATGEKRDITVSTQAAGGYLLAPIKTSEDIVKQIDNLVFVRQRARKYKVDQAQAVGVRQMTSRLGAPAWTTEVGQLIPDNTLTFGRRDLTPNLLAKLVTESIRIFESGVDVESIVNEELAYQFATTEENAFLNGTGAGQPLGAFVASASGIPASQDYASSGTATFTADDLIGMRYNIKQPYLTDMKKSAWIFNRTIVKTIRTFKDSYGQYLWRPGFAENAPDTILDIPYGVSEYAPNTVATGNYVGILGNWDYYAIAEVRDMTIQRLVERYADINEIGFIGRRYLDGSPVLGEAFTRLKLS